MPNTEHLKNVESYLTDLQRMEFNLSKDGGQIDRLIVGGMTSEGIYTRIGELNAMQKELENMLLRITEKTGDRGRLMANKAMGKFLESSERRDITQKQLRRINQMNARSVSRRIEYYKLRLSNEIKVLEGQVKEFFVNGRLTGRTSKQMLAELTRAAGDKQGLAAGFSKRIKRITIDAARREAQQRAQEEYHKIAKPGEKWQWITVSSTPCPDCQARAGVIMTYEAWQSMGVPGAGRTICGASCKCQLVPVSVADQQFPDAKQFTWNKEKLVLTTFGESRRLGAKSNQPK